MNHAPDRGFTMIELMVTLAILAIVAALVAPGFSDSLARTRVRSQATDIAGLFELARSESLKRNALTTTIAVANQGTDWRVSTEWQSANGDLELRSVASSGQVALVTPTVAGAMTLATAATLTADFRGLFSGYVSTAQCRAGDACIELRGPGNRYRLRLGINPVGQVITCAVGDAFGGYPSCP